MRIKHDCSRCKGAGELTTVDQYGTPSTNPCPDCDGDGSIDGGTIPELADIMDKCNDILEKLNE